MTDPTTCSVNMGLIHLQAGDLTSAYRFFLPLAQAGDREAIGHLIDICERAGDEERAQTWRAELTTDADAEAVTDEAVPDADLVVGAATPVTSGAARGLAAWHEVLDRRDPEALRALLADDAVFRSPVVFRAQVGRDLAAMYLMGAMAVLGDAGFHYTRIVREGSDAICEFEAELDGTLVNGVDIIRFNDAGEIIDFTVMLRPLRGLEAVRTRMAALLGG